MKENRAAHHGMMQLAVRSFERVPGKQTQVMAALSSENTDIQCKADPIQRQGSAEGPPPDPVYQYAEGTTHINDCGPASLVGILRVMGMEATFNAWILAHRPMENGAIATAYQEHYPGAQSGTVDPQEQLDVARSCVSTGAQTLQRYGLSVPTQERDYVLDPGQLRTALIGMLQLIGAQIPDNVNEFLPLASDGEDNLRGVDAASPASRNDLLRYLYRHCSGDQAVILLGAPTSWQQDENGRSVEVPAWGWGGDTPSAGGRTVGIDPGNGHFVIVHSFNRGTKMFTLLDPSFATPQQVTRDQLVQFITNRGGTLANMLTVPLSTVRSWIPAAQPKRGGGAMAANVPAPTGGGAPLPAATQARMGRSFGADFSSVRVHEDDSAAQIGALGYTQGNDVHFAPGQYRPGTPAGDTLLGHELAHVVQQREGRVAAPQGKGGIVEDPALEAEADQQGERAAAGQSARAASSSLQVDAPVVQRQDGGTGSPLPTLNLPSGPIPEVLLQALARNPSMAIHVAQWCTAHLLQREQMRSFWASADPATRGAQLGEMAVQLGRLEFMLGWIQQGGLSIATTAGWETRGTSADNLSREQGDQSSNRGTFPDRYQSQYGGAGGMAGYDWCGMFIGYLYSDLLQLDDPSMGSAGTEGWRGADTVLQSGEPKLWPIREVTDPSRFGQFVSWGDGGRPRAGDVLVISGEAFNQDVGTAIRNGNPASDPRTPTHVGMVEEATDEYVRTIDGNVSLLATSIRGSSDGSRSPNAVSGRAYNFGSQFTDREGAAYHYNHSRIICAVRITERTSNFAAPASGTPAGGTPAVTGEALMARLAAANAQVEAVLNSLSGTSRPFSAQGTVREWARGQGA